jgi:two-component system NarL family response regulator
MGIPVLIVDDHRLMRQGLAWLLQREADIEVVGEAGDGETAVEEAVRRQPEVVLMDLSLPTMSGVEATRALLEQVPTARVLGVSASMDRQQIMNMLEAGASGYLVKTADCMELLHAIRTVAAGRNYISPDVAGLLVESYVRREYPVADGGLCSLGSREREVLQMVAEGCTSKEIATRMNVTRSTVESHRRNIMRKLNLKGVAEMTRFAIRSGLTNT